MAELRDVRLGARVAAVAPLAGGLVRVEYERGGETFHDVFDEVVLATHADVSLRLLGGHATAGQRSVLEGVPYSQNAVYVHTDPALMPKARNAWAAWNCLCSNGAGGDAAPVCVSYWLNVLQNLPAGTPDLFVTLNPATPPEKAKTLHECRLDHPVFGFASDAAQRRLPEVQGENHVWLAGAWCGYGFHEDGMRAALAVCEGLGAAPPWAGQERCLSPKVALRDALFLRAFDGFARRALTRGHLRMILPTGAELSYGDPGTAATFERPGGGGRSPLKAVVHVNDLALFADIVLRHDSGMGEAFFKGRFECDDLYAFMAVITTNVRNIQANRGQMGLVGGALNWAGDKLLYLAHLARANSILGSRRNIQEHYDAGNAMYGVFLDPSMMYSCAIFEQPGDRDLYSAQMRKLDYIIDQADIQASDHVLEIGCGWGAFAIRAAKTRGCRVTGVTISLEQLKYANAKVKEAGLQDRITLRLCDYRLLEETFDKVVSIEMIEAVGHEFLPGYFRCVADRLKVGGKAVIQAISTTDDKYDEYCRSSDFIREHIFPGGHLPCMGVMQSCAEAAGLKVANVRDIGLDYATTLELWREAWEARRPEVLALGYSEEFFRKYVFYFVYCAAGFQEKYIHDFVITWAKEKEVPRPEAPAGTLARGAPAVGAALALALAAGVGFAAGQLSCEGSGSGAYGKAVLLSAVGLSAAGGLLFRALAGSAGAQGKLKIA